VASAPARAALGVCFAAWLAASSAGHAAIVDCLADGVVSFQSGFTDPNTGFRYSELPGIVLGPPGASLPVQGSTSVLSLGVAGVITLAFTDNLIVDGPGPDFIVFENAFFKGSVPSSPTSTCNVFAEPGSVAVSGDGVTWTAFPYDVGALSLVGQDQTPCSAIPLLGGLAGLTPTFTGNWTVPDDPSVWDTAGTGGVSGAGGDAFDLADVGLTQARFVRITDLALGTGFAGNAEGFDLDAVVAINSIPSPPVGPDSDGDGLTDADEQIIYLTDPLGSDSDGDQTPDGEEVAGCRSPLTSAASAWFIYSADLIFPAQATDQLRWNFLSATSTYDLIRGTLASVDAASDPVDLGPVACIDENSFNLTSGDHPDAAIPPAGGGFFYLLRPSGGSYGPASDGRPRAPLSGDCLP